jgi:hypothetical protein
MKTAAYDPIARRLNKINSSCAIPRPNHTNMFKVSYIIRKYMCIILHFNQLQNILHSKFHIGSFCLKLINVANTLNFII